MTLDKRQNVKVKLLEFIRLFEDGVFDEELKLQKSLTDCDGCKHFLMGDCVIDYHCKRGFVDRYEAKEIK